MILGAKRLVVTIYIQYHLCLKYEFALVRVKELLEGKQHSSQPVSARAHRLKLVGFVQTRVIRYIHNP